MLAAARSPCFRSDDSKGSGSGSGSSKPSWITTDAETLKSFSGTDILSVQQFSRLQLDTLFQLADFVKHGVATNGGLDWAKGRLLTALFYEPSTRTSSSFQAAMLRLGGSVIPITDVKSSSVAKGETIEDTVRCLESYSDVIVMRHPEVGSAALAAHSAQIPIINGGDGVGEHPTQALLDLYTILRDLGHVDGLIITMLGDLKHGRTVHSLARLLALYKVRLNYVSPALLQMPAELVEELRAKGVSQRHAASLQEVIGDSDVLYVTRVQKERFVNLSEYEDASRSYVITPETLALAKPQMIVMHPLPRVNEISTAVDSDPRAAYFRQMQNGLYVRMALLALVLGVVPAHA